MKKALAIIALAVFLGGISAPTFANANTTLFTISLADEDPKKATTQASSEEAAEAPAAEQAEATEGCSGTKKAAASDCSTTEETAEASSECTGQAAKKPCASTCGGGSK